MSRSSSGHPPAVTPYTLETPEEIAQDLAARVRELRLAKAWRQITLAERAGVSLGSLRRFEETGKGSLATLLRLAFALGRLSDFKSLLKPPPATTLAELEADENKPPRQRGRI